MTGDISYISSNYFKTSSWRDIGKQGMYKDCNSDIPWEVITQDGRVLCDTDSVINEWICEFAKIYNSVLTECENEHLT